MRCIVCGVPTYGSNGLCAGHHLPYDRAWCLSERTGVIKRFVDDYKFHGVKEGYVALASLLDTVLPSLPENTLVVPIPTTPANIRIRNYDHMLLIASKFARMRNLEIATPLLRRNNTTQHFAKSAKERQGQAEGFFEVKHPIDTQKPYLILDDIFTTGSTVKAAASKLKESGVSEVWLGVIAKQS